MRIELADTEFKYQNMVLIKLWPNDLSLYQFVCNFSLSTYLMMKNCFFK